MIRFYNTLGRKKQEFIPIKEGCAGIYSCGPTVYNYAHIGNLRSYIFADVLKKTLIYFGYDVRHVMNVTDVGHLTGDQDSGADKMERQAARTGKDVREIADFYEKAFFEDLSRLNIMTPTVICRATDHIQEMQDMVKTLLDKGFAYETEQAIYFDISRFPEYTELSGQSIQDKVVGARDEVNEDPDKRHPADFAVWFKCTGRFAEHLMRWPSPWGEGFPGWHIECSAMSIKYLGETFDIHTGGEDHVWVHHPNEIAQSQCCTGRKFVNYWMHGAFLVVGKDGEAKMSKSEGNFLRLQSLIDAGFEPVHYRYFTYQAHYRNMLKFTDESLTAARNAYERIRAFIMRAVQMKGPRPDWTGEYVTRFEEAISDDLNMPAAIGVMNEMINRAAETGEYNILEELFRFDRVLSLGFEDIAASVSSDSGEIDALIEERNRARAEKNWSRADEIRDQLAQRGIILEDTKTGTVWHKE
ncbi:MAG: cysteine--tRNA ligase [Abditibacteriota bacterium]|nr:cysteine--tRNA ligase [Abditibacteriota bacterium]